MSLWASGDLVEPGDVEVLIPGACVIELAGEASYEYGDALIRVLDGLDALEAAWPPAQGVPADGADASLDRALALQREGLMPIAMSSWLSRLRGWGYSVAMTHRARSDGQNAKVAAARRAGFASGAASVFKLHGPSKPAPPKVRRSLGSLKQDSKAIQRDGQRLFRDTRS